MKYEVYTIIQARIVVEADNETHAYSEAEGNALAIVNQHLETRGQIIAAAREADEVME